MVQNRGLGLSVRPRPASTLQVVGLRRLPSNPVQRRAALDAIESSRMSSLTTQAHWALATSVSINDLVLPADEFGLAH